VEALHLPELGVLQLGLASESGVLKLCTVPIGRLPKELGVMPHEHGLMEERGFAQPPLGLVERRLAVAGQLRSKLGLPKLGLATRLCLEGRAIIARPARFAAIRVRCAALCPRGVRHVVRALRGRNRARHA
jgi:hypothetical protein